MVLTQCSPQMSNTFKNNNLNKLNLQNFDWNSIQIEMKNKLGNDIYESWLKKINLVEEFNNYLLLSVPTRFIRDWITSHYLDKIIFFLTHTLWNLKDVFFPYQHPHKYIGDYN